MIQKGFIIISFLLLGVFSAWADDSGRLYGRITTTRGDILEGYIRWDKNEGSWVDILNGTKELHGGEESRNDRSGRRRYGRTRSRIKLFGVTIGGRDDWSLVAQSSIRMGHIASIRVIDDDRAELVLKSGQRIDFFNGSTDIGSSIREIIIEDAREGELELVWDDIDKVEFMPAGGGEPSGFGDRLYGTLTTRRGDEYTGFVCWDIDELFVTDILDGEVRGRKRKIRFGKIKTIERYSSKGATVTLKSGDELLMKGTNDVNKSNRGILILDPALGQVQVPWSEFDKLEFASGPGGIGYGQFDGGSHLSGTVRTEDGEEFTGRIRWDNDEEYSWEMLNGSYGRIDFQIEFAFIRSIEKISRRGSEVTLSDGRVFRLRGSNDVDGDNKGVYVILADGDEVRVDWDDFASVAFSN